jgi:hypothetical protein
MIGARRFGFSRRKQALDGLDQDIRDHKSRG